MDLCTEVAWSDPTENCHSNLNKLTFPLEIEMHSLRESRNLSSMELCRWVFRNLCQDFTHGPPISGKLSFCIRMNMFCSCALCQEIIFMFSVVSENKRLCYIFNRH